MNLDGVLETSIVGSFSNLGHRLRSRNWTELDGGARGRTAIITGATSGIGLATATRLAGLGAKPVLVARNESKAASVVADITASTGNPDVSYALADLSSLEDVRRLADNLLEQEASIDILVNNAGVLPETRSETEDGIELTLATNLVGPFLLTNLLIPRMVASAPARIINVSSGGMYTQRIDTSDLQSERGDFNGTVAYAKTKRGQVILTELWAERLAGTGVVVSAMHPGWVDTPGVKDSLPAFHRVMRPFLRTPDEGADTIVWLATDDAALETTGRFWHDRQTRPIHRLGRTKETRAERDELWSQLSRLSGWEPPAGWPTA